jgi:hypothetical protein
VAKSLSRPSAPEPGGGPGSISAVFGDNPGRLDIARPLPPGFRRPWPPWPPSYIEVRTGKVRAP